jgi:hypothetical protein
VGDKLDHDFQQIGLFVFFNLMLTKSMQFHRGELPAAAPAAMEMKVRKSTQSGWPCISENRLRFEGTRFLHEL